MTSARVIILLSGKRKSGKDYVADLLLNKLGAELCCILRLSGPLKRQYAQEHELDAERLLDASEYKERYRAAMIRWGEERRCQDPGYFCRLVASGPGSEKPVWLISDARRQTDIEFFRRQFDCRVITVRIVADDEARKRRGWTFTPGVDDVASECDLDTGVSFDVVIDNSGDVDRLRTQVTQLIHSIQSAANQK